LIFCWLMAAELVCKFGHALKRAQPKSVSTPTENRACQQCNSVSDAVARWYCSTCEHPVCFACARSKRRDLLVSREESPQPAPCVAVGSSVSSPINLDALSTSAAVHKPAARSMRKAQEQCSLPPLPPTAGRSASSIAAGKLAVGVQRAASPSPQTAEPQPRVGQARARSTSAPRSRLELAFTPERPRSALRLRGSVGGIVKRVSFTPQVEWNFFDDGQPPEAATRICKPIRGEEQQRMYLTFGPGKIANLASLVSSSTPRGSPETQMFFAGTSDALVNRAASASRKAADAGFAPPTARSMAMAARQRAASGSPAPVNFANPPSTPAARQRTASSSPSPAARSALHAGGTLVRRQRGVASSSPNRAVTPRGRNCGDQVAVAGSSLPRSLIAPLLAY